MKLRQKLAAALATAMVVTSVPVVTMAASNNKVVKSTQIIEEDTITTDSALRIKFEDGAGDKEEFYLTLTNAEWLEIKADSKEEEALSKTKGFVNFGTKQDGTVDYDVWNFEYASAKNNDNTVSVTYTRQDDDTVKVEVSAAVKDEQINFPLPVKAKTGEMSVAVVAEGSDTTVTEGKYVFATTSNEVATVSVGEPETISEEGKVGKIILSEAYVGSMNNNGSKYALVELNEADFEFDLSNCGSALGKYDVKKTGDKITVTAGTEYTKYEMPAKFTYGFAGTSTSTVAVYVSSDRDSMYVEMSAPAGLSATRSKGKIELNELYVKSTVKNPAEGNITVDVTGNVEDARNLVVAVNGNYGAVITVEDGEKVEIKAGETEEVNFTIEEAVDGTFTDGRKMDVKLSNGYLMDAKFTDETETKVDEKATLEEVRKNFGTIKVNDKAIDVKTAITDVEIEDEKVVGFTINPGTIQRKGEIDEIEFEFDLLAGIEDKGEVKVSVTSRDLDKEVTGVIAEIKAAVEVTSEQVVLKAGLMNQVGGKITITEAQAGALNRNEQVSVKLPDVKGINFVDSKEKLPEVNVTTGDAQVSDVKIVNGELRFTIKRDSKTASTIEISNFHIDTDRTVAEGTYEVELGGKALTSHDETIELSDFIKIGTANTEDLVGANGLTKGTSTFVIGESKYTVNGVEKEMDAKSYIQDPGFTMVPVRFVAEAFGVTGNNIMFSNGTATFFAGTRTIQLTNNSDVAVVNGVQVKMATKVVMKDGRTYAPIGEVAQLLGISKDWDNASKTATFVNR